MQSQEQRKAAEKRPREFIGNESPWAWRKILYFTDEKIYTDKYCFETTYTP